MNCPICKHHKKDLQNSIKHSASWVLRHSEPAKNCPGYLYVEPIRHIENISNLNSLESEELGTFLQWGSDYIEKNFSPEKIYIVTISEKVPHIHFHLVPRYEDEPKGLEYLKLALNGELKKR